MYNDVFNYIKIGMCKLGNITQRTAEHSETLSAKLNHDQRMLALMKSAENVHVYHRLNALNHNVDFTSYNDMKILRTYDLNSTNHDTRTLEKNVRNEFKYLYDKLDMNNNGTDSKEWFYNDPTGENHKTPAELCEYFDHVIQTNTAN
jgi:hypothetical protein